MKIKNLLPQNLMGRTMLIVIFPFIAFQLIILSYYYNSLWERTLLQLSRSVVMEINFILNSYENNDNEVIDKSFYEDYLGLELDVHSNLNKIIEGNQARQDIILKSLRTELNNSIKHTAYIQELLDAEKILVAIPLDDKIFEFIFYKKRITTSRNHIFLGWQILSSLILIFISIIFLKNQIKPIINLAKAAESFGKGLDAKDFKISGASEVRLASFEFLKMKNRIIRQIEQRSMMLAGVSHDLKTPLTRIRLQTEAIEDDKIKESLNDEVNHMSEMLNEYLEFSSSGQNTKVENINVIESIVKIKNDINFKNKNIELIVINDHPSTVNENIFNRVIINILNNAIIFSNIVKIIVEVDEKVIKINIHDNGPGISEKEKKNVFKPFYRIDKSRNQNYGNSGLGLSITKSLLSQINGTINLKDSSLGGLDVELKIENY